MAERNEFVPHNLVGRELLAAIDQFRAASNASATATSGHTNATSAAVSVVAVTLSDVVALRMVNAHLFNGDQQWMTLEFRDGSFIGRRLFGPITIPAGGEKYLKPDDVMGRAAFSGISVVILSGQVASGQPIASNGVIIDVGFVLDPFTTLKE